MTASNTTRHIPKPGRIIALLALLPLVLMSLVPAGTARAQTSPDDDYWDTTFGNRGVNKSGNWPAEVHILRIDGNDLYVGGEFDRVDTLSTNSVGRWDGTRWYGMDGGKAMRVHSLSVLDGTPYPGGDMLLRIEQHPTWYTYVYRGLVAAHQGEEWQSIGWADNPSNIYNAHAWIRSSEVFRGDLYVGGTMTVVNGVWAEGLARRRAGVWEQVGGGLVENVTVYTAQVTAMATDGTRLYMGGFFTHGMDPGGTGDVYSRNLIAWNGSGWEAVPGPGHSRIADGIRCLAWAPEGLYVGGRFTLGVGGTNFVENVVLWDGTAWRSLNGGTNGLVSGMYVHDGQLYIAGEFTSAGRTACRNLARWDGSDWSPIGSGIPSNYGASAVAVSGQGEVFVGGRFAGVGANGSIRSRGVARWHNPIPYPAHPAPRNWRQNVRTDEALTWGSAGTAPPPDSWDLYFGTTNPPPLVATQLKDPVYDPGPLDHVTRYYWRAVAHDAASNQATGKLWNFTTEDSVTSKLIVSSAVAACGPLGEDTVSVLVRVTDLPAGFEAGGVDIAYDPQRLTFVDCEPGALVSSWALFDCADQGSVVRVGGTTDQVVAPGADGVFATLRFVAHCCDAGQDETTALTALNLVDDFGGLRPEDGGVTCISPPANGDVNGDGTVTTSDALCVFDAYLDYPRLRPGTCATVGWDARADVDCNGRITPADAQCIDTHARGGTCDFCGTPAPASGSPGAVAGLSVAVTHGEEGAVVLTLSLEGAGSMTAFGFDFHYDGDVLRFTGSVPDTLTGGFDGMDGRWVSKGLGRVGAYNSVPRSYSGGDVVTTLHFQRMDATASSEITIDTYVDDFEDVAPLRVAVAPSSTPVASYALHQNFPNPFNPSTEIQYEIPDGAGAVPVEIIIYDVRGAHVRTLERTTRPGGVYSVSWDGSNQAGQRVATGVYFYALRSGSVLLTRKLVLMK